VSRLGSMFVPLVSHLCKNEHRQAAAYEPQSSMQPPAGLCRATAASNVDRSEWLSVLHHLFIFYS
jgi:hypothetical protein